MRVRPLEPGREGLGLGPRIYRGGVLAPGQLRERLGLYEGRRKSGPRGNRVTADRHRFKRGQRRAGAGGHVAAVQIPGSQSGPAGGHGGGPRVHHSTPSPGRESLWAKEQKACQALCGLWGRMRGTLPLPSTAHGVQRHRPPPPPPEEKPRPGREGGWAQVPQLKSGCRDSNSGLALCPVLLPLRSP